MFVTQSLYISPHVSSYSDNNFDEQINPALDVSQAETHDTCQDVLSSASKYLLLSNQSQAGVASSDV